MAIIRSCWCAPAPPSRPANRSRAPATPAARLGVGLAPVRKPGKLPWRSVRETYSLEYGTDSLEMHEDAVSGERCLIVDDLLATGGTAAATARLVQRQGGHITGFAFVIE